MRLVIAVMIVLLLSTTAALANQALLVEPQAIADVGDLVIARSPIDIDGQWYILADDFAKLETDYSHYDSETKTFHAYWNSKAVTLEAGSSQGEVVDRAGVEQVSFSRPIWEDHGHLVLPLSELAPVLGVGLDYRDKRLFLSAAIADFEVKVEDQPPWAGIDLVQQRLFLYRGDWRIMTVLCSTGIGKHGKDWKKYRDVYWVIRIDGPWGYSITYKVETPYKWFFADSKGGYYNLKAIHGFYSVPPYPDSHGCIRIPIADGKLMYEKNLLPVDSPVQVQLSEAKFKPWRDLFR